MAITISVTQSTNLPGGFRLISGTVTFDDSYPTGGETMDLSSYLLSTSSPTVIINGDDGYVIQHDRGTAAAGKLIAYGTGSANKAALTQQDATTNLSTVICPFTAIGQAA